jgi:NADH-quinone oxidoreductase subunit N
MNLHNVILPELVLVVIACGLLVLGISTKVSARRAAAALALVAIVAVTVIQGMTVSQDSATIHSGFKSADGLEELRGFDAIEVGPFANYIKLITGIVGTLLVLLAWPTNPDATGSRSLDFGRDAGEFYGLMLLSIAGLMLVAGANDIMLLFLGIELASIPTYIMVSMSRPLPAAQEAGVKYFFLGAMAAAIMLFGFSYLYGTTGLTKLTDIRAFFNPPGTDSREAVHAFTHWQVLAVCMMLAGFAFKIAAVPLHAYVGDVYQGAATPLTAFLAFVPKTSGFVAIIKVLAAFGGSDWKVPEQVVSLLWVLAVLTMTVGNTLGLLQHNIKRVLAYSSIAHSGYMLVGITALVAAAGTAAADMPLVHRNEVQRQALAAVLFYLAAYGIMNSGAFGVLMLLPSRERRYHRSDGNTSEPTPATSAETYEDIAGIGSRHMGLALAMTVCCFSLIGLPFTIGFFGKLYLIQPVFKIGTRQMNWLGALTMVNAAIGAAYYLRIIATMFLRPEVTVARDTSQTTPASSTVLSYETPSTPERPWWTSPIGASIVLSVILTLVFGAVFPLTNELSDRSNEAAYLEPPRYRSGPVPAESLPEVTAPALSRAQP